MKRLSENELEALEVLATERDRDGGSLWSDYVLRLLPEVKETRAGLTFDEYLKHYCSVKCSCKFLCIPEVNPYHYDHLGRHFPIEGE